MEHLKPSHAKILDAIVAEYLDTAVAPTAARVRDLTGHKGTTIAYALRSLCLAGYCKQARYHGGPVRPLFTSDCLRVVADVRIEGPV